MSGARALARELPRSILSSAHLARRLLDPDKNAKHMSNFQDHSVGFPKKCQSPTREVSMAMDFFANPPCRAVVGGGP